MDELSETDKFLLALQDKMQEIRDRNEWLDRKIDHVRRMAEHRQYFAEHFPEILQPGTKGRFLDIGCGPGESLILARENGWEAVGIEHDTGEGGMGRDYVLYGQIYHTLNGLTVKYGNARQVVSQLASQTEDGLDLFDCINMRGSFEQVFSDCMDGPPHDLHHKASSMRWRIDSETRREIRSFFSDLYYISNWASDVIIHFNGSANHQELVETLDRILCGRDGDHKWESEHVLRLVG